MALTKKFTDQVIALSNRGVAVAESAHTLGKVAVKAAYSNADLEPAQYLMDNLPKYIQQAMFNWFKRAGLDIIAPTTGEKLYKVMQVVDQKRQSKVFEWVEANPVMVIEVKEVAAPKDKVLKGTAEERAHKAMQSLITRLKESDPETSALINDVYATMNYTNVMFDGQSHKIEMDADEVKWFTEKLTERRLTARLAA
jgi:alpha-galactosidase/6-phospho-beta-glucosidase family protein